MNILKERISSSVVIQWVVSESYTGTYNNTYTITYPVTCSAKALVGAFTPASSSNAAVGITMNFDQITNTSARIRNWCYSSSHKHTKYWVLIVGTF